MYQHLAKGAGAACMMAAVGIGPAVVNSDPACGEQRRAMCSLPAHEQPDGNDRGPWPSPTRGNSPLMGTNSSSANTTGGSSVDCRTPGWTPAGSLDLTLI